MSIHAAFARLLKPRSVVAIPATAAFCQPISRAVSGPAPTAGQPQSYAGAARRKREWALLIEREILIAEIKHLHRQRKGCSSKQAELRAVVAELLTIG